MRPVATDLFQLREKERGEESFLNSQIYQFFEKEGMRERWVSSTARFRTV